LASLHGISLPKNVDEFGLAKSKLKGKTLFYIPNEFLKAFLNLQTSWQWQLHYEKLYINHCVSIGFATFYWSLSENVDGLGWPYEN